MPGGHGTGVEGDRDQVTCEWVDCIAWVFFSFLSSFFFLFSFSSSIKLEVAMMVVNKENGI